jgi:hypothetical protein
MQFEKLQCWYYYWEGFVLCTVQMASGGRIYIQSFMKIDSGIQIFFGWGNYTYRHTHEKVIS